MKDVDDLLRRHQAPQPDRRLSDDFTNNVIAGIEFEPRHKPRRSARLQEYLMCITHLPKYAVFSLAILAAGTISTGAYAAFQWITPNVTVQHITPKNDENKREYSIAAQCGTLDSGSYKYELQQNSTLTDNQVYDVFKNTCDYQAIENFANGQWVSDNTHDDVAKKKPGDNVTIYEDRSVFIGATDANKIFGLMLGKITALSDTSVTISTTVYQTESVDNGIAYFPEGKTISRTWPVLPGMEIWENGAQQAAGDIKVGDTVQLVEKTVQPLDAQKHLGPLSEWGITAMIKTTVDTGLIYDATIGNPAIINQIAGLTGCTNNPDYLCVSPISQREGLVYSTSADIKEKNNMQYLRKDISSSDAKNFHQLDGRILNMSGTHVTLQTRGASKTFSVDLPYDAISSYNKTNSPTVSVGDLVEVDYLQKPSEDHLEITSGDILNFATLQHVDASGVVHNY